VGEPRGTAAYASPEQARGEWSRVDERSDVYALGGTLYALLTGHGPHQAATLDEQWAMARAGQVLPPTAAAGRTLPPGLVEIALRALAPEPADRYPSASAFQSALRNFWIEQGRFPLESYPAGATLLTEGQDAEAAYVIQQGRCRASRLVDGKPQVLREMGPGDVFGELAVLDHGVRSATVVTLEPTVVVKMGRDVFDQALSEGLWLARFVRALSNRFRDVEDELLHVARQHRQAELGRAALKALLQGQPDWAPLRAALAAEWRLSADELDRLAASLPDVRLGEDGRLALRSPPPAFVPQADPS
jgi:serine/threonine-protein kinase